MVHHVYAILNPLKPGNFIFDELEFDFEPFYIGKGSRNTRSTSHLQEAKRVENKSHKVNTIRKIWDSGNEPVVKILEWFETHEEALEREKELISLIGRKDKELGPLTNQTDGGEGCMGRKCSDETIQKLKNSHIGHSHSKETREKISKIVSLRPKNVKNKLIKILKKRLRELKHQLMIEKDREKEEAKRNRSILRENKRLEKKLEKEKREYEKEQKRLEKESLNKEQPQYEYIKDPIERKIMRGKRISAANKGKIRSEESRANISNGRKGIKLTEDTKEKLRNINLGKTHSDETKQKMSKASKGKPKSPEAIINMTKARRARMAKDKE